MYSSPVTKEASLLRGRCLCGSVTYRVVSAPQWVGHCHCDSCRRGSGAPFVTWATVLRRAYLLIGPIRDYRSEQGNVRRTCSRCSTPLTFCRPHTDEIDFTVATLENPELLHPTEHVWASMRLSWTHDLDSLPADPNDNSHAKLPILINPL